MSIITSGITFDIMARISGMRAELRAAEAEVKATAARINQIKAEVAVGFDAKTIPQKVQQINQEVSAAKAAQVKIPVGFDIEQVRAEARKIDAEVATMKQAVRMPVSIATDQSKPIDAEAVIKQQAPKAVSVPVVVDTAAAQTQLKALDQEIAKLNAERVTIAAGADTSQARQQLSLLDSAINGLQQQRIQLQAGLDTSKVQQGTGAGAGGAAIASAGAVGVPVAVDTAAAQAQLAELDRQIATLNAEKVNIAAAGDTTEARQQLSLLEAEINGMEQKRIELQARLDTSNVEEGAAKIEAEAKRLSSKDIQVDAKINADQAMADVRQLDVEIAKLKAERVNVAATGDTKEARQQLGLLDNAIKGMEQRRIQLQAELDTSGVKQGAQTIDAEAKRISSEVVRMKSEMNVEKVVTSARQIDREVAELNAHPVAVPVKVDQIITAQREVERLQKELAALNAQEAQARGAGALAPGAAQGFRTQRNTINQNLGRAMGDLAVAGAGAGGMGVAPTMEAAAKSAGKVTAEAKAVSVELGHATAKGTDFANILGKLATSRGISGIASSLKSIGPPAGIAIAALKAVQIQLELLSIARDESIHKAAGNLDALVEDEAKINAARRGVPLLGPAVAFAHEAVTGAQAKIDNTKFEAERDSKRAEEGIQRGKAIQRMREDAEAEKRALNLEAAQEGQDPAAAALLAIRAKRAEFERVHQLSKTQRLPEVEAERTGLIAAEQRAQAAVTREVGAGHNAREAAENEHQKHMADIVLEGETARLRAIGAVHEAERKEFLAHLDQQEKDARAAVDEAKNRPVKNEQERVQRDTDIVTRTAELKAVQTARPAREAEKEVEFHKQQTDIVEQEADKQREIARSLEDYKLAVLEASLRAQGRDYEADTVAFKRSWDEKIAALQKAADQAEKEAKKIQEAVESPDQTRADAGKAAADATARVTEAEKAKTEETAGREAQAHKSADNLRAQAAELNLRTEGRSKEAEFAALKRETDELIQSAGGDADKLEAATEVAKAKLDAFLKEMREADRFTEGRAVRASTEDLLSRFGPTGSEKAAAIQQAEAERDKFIAELTELKAKIVQGTAPDQRVVQPQGADQQATTQPADGSEQKRASMPAGQVGASSFGIGTDHRILTDIHNTDKELLAALLKIADSIRDGIPAVTT